MTDEWRIIPFEQAVEINPSIPLVQGALYPFVDMQAIEPSSRTVGPSEFRVFTGSGSRFQNGDTLMARITPCLENGKFARFYSSEDLPCGHGSTEFIVIRGREGVTDNDFAYYLTRSELVRGYAISQMTGTSGRQRVPVSALSHLNVPVPPLPEQRAIAHILGTLDDKIELNRRMNATLEAIARAIFKSWFVDFDPVHAKARGEQPAGMDAETAALFPDSFEESELGMIPRGWGVEPLDEIANFQNGLALQNYPPEGDQYLPVIKIRELRQGYVDDKSDKASPYIREECILNDGDAVFSWSGSLLLDIWCGGTAALNQHLFKVTSERYPKWFYYFWTLHHLQDFRRIAAGKATTMGHIQRHHLSAAFAAVPPTALIEHAHQIIAPCLDAFVSNRLQSRTLAELRDALLPKLMSGEVRLGDAEEFLRCGSHE